MSMQLLKMSLADAEREADSLRIFEIAFFIGSFPADSLVRTWVADCECPKIKELLLKVKPLSDDTSALIWLAGWKDRLDHAGLVAHAIRSALRSARV